MRAGTTHTQPHKSLRARAIAVRAVLLLAAVFIAVGFQMSAPMLADGAESIGQAFEEALADIERAQEPAAPPEQVEEALALVNAVATTPMKTLTSALLNHVVPWTYAHPRAVALLLGLGAGLLVAHAIERTRKPADVVPFD